jgi:hypothetical protein
VVGFPSLWEKQRPDYGQYFFMSWEFTEKRR